MTNNQTSDSRRDESEANCMPIHRKLGLLKWGCEKQHPLIWCLNKEFAVIATTVTSMISTVNFQLETLWFSTTQWVVL